MKTRLLFGFFFLLTAFTFSQNDKAKLYNPDANAKADIATAVTLADSTGKNVLLQIGGNWCKWCLRFNKFCKSDHVIDSLLQSDYVIVHVNYSSENKNLEVLKTLGFPQRFGFPVIVILDSKGNRLHTQDTGLLELDENYNREKIITFLSNWNPAALKPENYEK